MSPTTKKRRQKPDKGGAHSAIFGLGLLLLNVCIVVFVVPFTSREMPPIVNFVLVAIVFLNPILTFALVRSAFHGHHNLQGAGLLALNLGHFMVVSVAMIVFAYFVGPTLDVRVHGLFTVPGHCSVCPPGPPASGPGSPTYAFARVKMTGFGSGNDRYWIIEADDPRPRTAPVIVYLHGYGAAPLSKVPKMLEHFARKGYIIVYPQYGSVTTNIAASGRNARQAIVEALEELRRPERSLRANDKIAYMGLSMGAGIAVMLAGQPDESPSIPPPAVVIAHEGGTGPRDDSFADYASIPASTYLLFIQAETSEGKLPGPGLGESVQVPVSHKNLLLVPSDGHGSTPLVSDHGGSVNFDNWLAPLDAIDWWGYWRPSEKALEELLLGKSGTYSVFCNTPGPECDAVRDMGLWSDGVPVKKIKNAGDLGLLQGQQ